MSKQHFVIWGVLLLVIGLAACRDSEALPTVAPTAALPGSTSDTAVSNPSPDQGAANTPTALPTDTAVPPSPTPLPPLAAWVNGDPLLLATYEKELARYENALSRWSGPDPANYRQLVLDALIEKMLIEQAAVARGITVTPQMVDQEIAALQSESDLQAWMETNLYTEAEFRQEIRQGLVVQQLIDQVTAGVPDTAEQVHTRYIHVDDLALANELLARAQNGDDFAFLADQFSLAPGNGGDLGWFARGSLLVPELEEPAFALQNSGDLTGIITVTGADGGLDYYLMQLIERDSARPLTADMYAQQLDAAWNAWLADLWQNATVERLVETGS